MPNAGDWSRIYLTGFHLLFLSWWGEVSQEELHVFCFGIDVEPPPVGEKQEDVFATDSRFARW